MKSLEEQASILLAPARSFHDSFIYSPCHSLVCFHVPGIYIMCHDISSISSKNSENVPLFIIEHHTIPHLQEAPSASCQPIAAATPTPAQCWTVSAWGTELLRFRIITVVTSTHLYDQAVTSSICNDMDIILQDKDIHGMEWYNGTIHHHYINTTPMQMRATKCRLLTHLTVTSLEGLHLACNRI